MSLSIRIISTPTAPQRHKVALGWSPFGSVLETDFMDTLKEARAIKKQWETIGGLDSWVRGHYGQLLNEEKK